MKIKNINKITVSVIIVAYKARKELIDCLNSIIKSIPKVEYEIIVVDNEMRSTIGNDIADKFPKVKYIKSKNNLGFGGGNNLGTHYARGEYLFFLNPDTKILNGAIDHLYNSFIENNNTGIASPVFLNNDLSPFKSQGSKELTLKNIIFSQSLLRKIFPGRNIYKEDILNKWDMKSRISVDVVPGAAMMISSSLFDEIGGFDKNIFLYFEENDISKRVASLGYELFIVPSAKIIHLVGRSTKNLEVMKSVYSKSRYFYLKKHHGLFKALLVRAILSINKTFMYLFSILIIALFLRIINIENNMQFIGDHGWFYLSARDMILDKTVPLVGIASSHPWLHQGPLWTYMLAGVFFLFGFNPLNGAYLTIALGTLSVLFIYIIGSEIFSKRVGFISALLYATSPLAVIYSRTPYHTSPIPLFTLLYIYSLYKWIKGNSMFFPLSILFLAILYNLELATSALLVTLLAILAYGVRKKRKWLRALLNKKIVAYSIVAFLVPMSPVLIYDFSHNFLQTLGFAEWIGYRILVFFGFPTLHAAQNSESAGSILPFSFHFYQKLIFPANNAIAFIILLSSFVVLAVTVSGLLRKKIPGTGIKLLALWISIPLVGYFINRIPSEAYLPIFFPALIYLVAISLDKVLKIRILLVPIVLLTLFIVLANSYFAILSAYSAEGLTLSKRITLVKEIVKKSESRKYNLLGKGDGSQFASFTMNYEYLAWWLGNPPVKTIQEIKYIINENKNIISLMEND